MMSKGKNGLEFSFSSGISWPLKSPNHSADPAYKQVCRLAMHYNSCKGVPELPVEIILIVTSKPAKTFK